MPTSSTSTADRTTARCVELATVYQDQLLEDPHPAKAPRVTTPPDGVCSLPRGSVAGVQWVGPPPQNHRLMSARGRRHRDRRTARTSQLASGLAPTSSSADSPSFTWTCISCDRAKSEQLMRSETNVASSFETIRRGYGFRADVFCAAAPCQGQRSSRSAEQKGPTMSTVSWIILIIVVLVIVAVVIFFVMNRRAGARRARAEQIRQEATQRAAELDRKEAEANAMAAEAQDARAEADRLESVSAEQRQETTAARDDVEESLRKADRIDPDAGRRSADVDDTGARRATARRATDEASDDVGARDRTVRDETAPDDTARDEPVRDETVRDEPVRDQTVRDETVRDERPSSPRSDVDEGSVRDDLRRNDGTGKDGVVDERSTDPRR